MTAALTNSLNAISSPTYHIMNAAITYGAASYIFGISNPLTAMVYSIANLALGYLVKTVLGKLFTVETNEDSKLIISTISLLIPMIGGNVIAQKATTVALSLMEVFKLFITSFVIQIPLYLMEKVYSRA